MLITLKHNTWHTCNTENGIGTWNTCINKQGQGIMS